MLFTGLIQICAYWSDTALMLLQYWFSAENMPVTELFGNGTVSGQNIFGYVSVRDFLIWTRFLSYDGNTYTSVLSSLTLTLGPMPRLTALYSPKGWLYPFDVRAWSWGPGLQRVSPSRSTWLLVSVARPKPRKTVGGPTMRSCCSRDRIFANGYTTPRSVVLDEWDLIKTRVRSVIQLY